MTDEEFVALLFNKIEAEEKSPTESGEEEIDVLVTEFIIKKLVPTEQKYFEDKTFVDIFTEYRQKLFQDHKQLMKRVSGQEPITPEDKIELKQIIRQIDNRPSDKQKIAIFNFYLEVNNISILLKQEAEKRLLTEEGQGVEMTGEMIYKNCIYAKIEYENILNKPGRKVDQHGQSINPSDDELRAEKIYRYYGQKINEFDQQFFPSIFGVNLDQLDKIKNVGEFNVKEMFSIIEDKLVQLVFSELETGVKSDYLIKEVPAYLDPLLKNMTDAGLKPKINNVDDLIEKYKKTLKEKTILVDLDGIKDEDDVIRIDDNDLQDEE